MTTKTLAAVGAALIVAGLGGAILAQQTPTQTPAEQKSNIEMLTMNDYRVLNDSRGMAILARAKSPKVRDALQLQADLVLSRNGIRVLTRDEVKNDTRWAMLTVDVKTDDLDLTYSMHTAYREPMYQMRTKRTLVMFPSPYDVVDSGRYDPDNLDAMKAVLVAQLEQLCADFKKANAKP